jgi:hypothetical protein
MFPKIERFLRLQKAEMMRLDKDEGLQAREDKGYDFSMPDPETGVKRGLREVLYENMIQWLLQDGRKILAKEFGELEQTPGALKEETLTTSFSAYTTALLPLVRRIYARLMALELVSVQPLSGPTGHLYWLDHLFGSNVGSVHTGDRMDLEQEKTFADSSEKGVISEMNFRLQKKLIQTETKKLQSVWTLEAGQDLKSQLGLDMWGELLPKLADEIMREIDSKLVAELLAQVAFNVDWSKTGFLPGDTTTKERKAYRKTIYEAIVEAGSRIFKRKFVYPNWLLMNAETFNYFAKLEKLVTFPGTDQNKPIEMGWAYKGTLDQKYRVYVNPWFTDNKVLMGFRSNDWRYAVGYYAPFIPLLVSDEFCIGGDFSQRARGVMSRYAFGAIGDDASDGKNYGLASVTLTES